MTRASHQSGRVSALALVAVLLGTGALAQASSLDAVRDLDGRGRTREALSRLEAEPASLADDPEARLLRGVLLTKLGRTAEARELYQRLILDHPEMPEAYNNLAVIHAAAGDHDTAIEILKQGLATHTSYRTTYDNLTKVYGKLAGEAYSKALGEDRIDAKPLRLALIDGLAQATPEAVEAPGRLADATPAPVEASPMVPAPVASRPAPSPPPASPPPAAGANAEQAVWQAVQAWADAWSEQRADAYLSYYDPRFVPPGGSSRAEWERLRRRRLAAPSYIRISLALLEVERPAPDRAIAHFVQSYESDRFRDTVTKALEMASTDGGWRIVGERVEEEPAG